MTHWAESEVPGRPDYSYSDGYYRSPEDELLEMQKKEKEIKEAEERIEREIKENYTVSDADSESIQQLFIEFFPGTGEDKVKINFSKFINCIEKSSIMKSIKSMKHMSMVNAVSKINNNNCYKKNKALIINFNSKIPPDVNVDIPYISSHKIYTFASSFLFVSHLNSNNTTYQVDHYDDSNRRILEFFKDSKYDVNNAKNYESKYIFFQIILEVINILFYLDGRSCKLWKSGNFIKKLHKIADCMTSNNTELVDDEVEGEGEGEGEVEGSTGGNKTRRKSKGRKTKHGRKNKKKTYKLKGRRIYKKTYRK